MQRLQLLSTSMCVYLLLSIETWYQILILRFAGFMIVSRDCLIPFYVHHFVGRWNGISVPSITFKQKVKYTPLTKFPLPQLKLQAKDFTYGEGPWGSNRLRTAMAKHMNRHFHTVVPIDKEELLFANGVTSLCTMLAFCIAEPGDGILMSSPIYQAFPLDFGLAAKYAFS